jgi:hypothetical protein
VSKCGTALQILNDSAAKATSDLARILIVCARGLLVFAALYSFFYAVDAGFPYLTSGSELVTHLKYDLARDGRPFDTSRGLKVMAFGNSKMLAGFIPSLFDEEMSRAGMPGVESYNYGLPGDSRFVAPLETLIARGTIPDVVLLLYPWPASDEPGPTFLHFAEHDAEIMDWLFPFHKLIRDFSIMVIDAHGVPRLVRENYLENERSVKQVEADKGYYFIARESHYPNHELPPDLKIATDAPNVVFPRIIPSGPVFYRLASVFRMHHIKCILVPGYFREGQLAAPPAINMQSVTALSPYANFGVAGPDYFLYPNRLFSDITHVNPQGAKTYTRAVASLVAQWLRQHPIDQ